MKRFSLIIVSLISIGIGVYIYTISQPTPLSTDEKNKVITLFATTPIPTMDTTSKRYDGKNFSFLYPSSATIGNPYSAYSATPSAVIETAGFSYKPGTIFAGVTLSTNQTFDKVPEIVYRRLHPDKYHEQTVKLGSISGVVFDSNDYKERIGFWPYRGDIVAIGIAGSDPQIVQQLFQQMLGSLELHLSN